MTIDALGGGTALTSTLAALTGSARDRARVQPPEPIEKDQEVAEAKVEPPENASRDEQSADPKSISDIAGEVAKNTQDSALTQLSILYDQDIDLFISRRIDPESGDVVRQFPYEEHLERARTFAEQNREDAEERLDLSV